VLLETGLDSGPRRPPQDRPGRPLTFAPRKRSCRSFSLEALGRSGRAWEELKGTGLLDFAGCLPGFKTFHPVGRCGAAGGRGGRWMPAIAPELLAGTGPPSPKTGSRRLAFGFIPGLPVNGSNNT